VATTTTTEQAAVALFALVTGAVPALKRKERHFRLPQDVSAPQTPALFQVQSIERYQWQQEIYGINPKRTFVVELIVYVTDAANTVGGVTTVGSTQLNAIVQAIKTSLRPDPTTNCQTLGGLVVSARIEGEIKYQEAHEIDGLSLAIIPVEMVFP
jgi:hypothetical protein